MAEALKEYIGATYDLKGATISGIWISGYGINITTTDGRCVRFVVDEAEYLPRVRRCPYVDLHLEEKLDLGLVDYERYREKCAQEAEEQLQQDALKEMQEFIRLRNKLFGDPTVQDNNIKPDNFEVTDG